MSGRTMVAAPDERPNTNLVAQIWQRWWPLLALIALCGLFFWDVVCLPDDAILGGNDLSNMFLHWTEFAVSTLRQGQLPLWNPYIFSGVPFVANPQPALFYPPMWLALLMPATRALSLVIVLHIWLSGAGMYAWLRAEGADVTGSLAGALVVAFSGYFFVRIRSGHIGVITTEAWLPLVLWAFRQADEARSWKLAAFSGLPLGLSILGGHTASFVYVALGLLAYALYRGYRGWRGERTWRAALLPLLWLALMTAVGLALAAAQLLPLAEFALRSSRQAAQSYEFSARYSWPPGYLLTLLVPNFFGEPVRTGYWGDGLYDELIFYIGVLPLILALLGARLRHSLRPFLIAMELGALFLSLGEYSVLHRLFYQILPVFRLTRAPGRAGFLLCFAGAALAGLTLTELHSTERQERLTLLAPLNNRLVGAVSTISAVLIVAGFMAYAWGRESNAAAGRLWHGANQTALFLLFFILSAALLATRRSRRDSGNWWGLLALGLIVLDLWTFGNGIVRIETTADNAYWRIVAETIPESEETRVLPWGLDDFEQNWNMRYGLSNVFGYDPLILQRYQEFIASRPDPQARTYDLLGARYLVTSAPQDSGDAAGVPQLVAENSGVWIYSREAAMPRAWIVPHVEMADPGTTLARIHDSTFDPYTTAYVESELTCPAIDSSTPAHVWITGYGNNRIEAETSGGGGLLVFSEVYYPGWRATVDGIRAPLVPADYVLRALCIQPGEHVVILTYDPPLLKVGLAISGVTLVGFVILALHLLQGRRCARRR